ncbi:MAG: GNAT family N-acetyltransferase [Candidatus Nanohalobium sp.]
MIKHFSSTRNSYRDEILEVMEKNNEETTPSIQEMTNKWVAEEELGLEDAVEKFYEERTDQVLLYHEKGLLKGFFLLEENDEDLKEKIPQYWPHIEVALGIVKQEFRGKGIAQRLFEETEKIMNKEGLENLVWVTSTANKASQNFAQKQGLEEATKFSEDREDDQKTVILAKKV